MAPDPAGDWEEAVGAPDDGELLLPADKGGDWAAAAAAAAKAAAATAADDDPLAAALN